MPRNRKATSSTKGANASEPRKAVYAKKKNKNATGPGRSGILKETATSRNRQISPDAIERDKIDREILLLETTFRNKVRLLNARRNLHVPISRLPTELLCKIFEFCRGHFPHDYQYEPYTYGTLSTSRISSSFRRWICLSWVCQHWRNTALAFGGLWNTPVTPHLNWTKEMLDRSKSSPLKIGTAWDHFQESTFSFQQALISQRREIASLVLQHLYRIQDLRISRMEREGSGPSFTAVMAALRTPAPILQTLEIGFPESEEYILPDDFLDGHAPQLSTLKLSRCLLPWSSTIFSPSMVTLVVDCPRSSYSGVVPQYIPVLSQLLDTLENMPNLSYLELQGPAIPQLDLPGLDGIPSPSRRIPLRNLVHIKLTAELRPTLNLLNHLDLPPTTTFYLACHSESWTTPSSHTLSIPLIRRYCGTDSAPVKKLELITSGHNPLSIPGCFFTSIWLHQETPLPKLPPSVSPVNTLVPQIIQSSASVHRASLFLSQNLSCLDGLPAVTVVQKYWSQTNLSRLKDVRLDTAVTPQVWLSVFGSLAELEEIAVFHEAPVSLIAAMKSNLQGIPKTKNLRGASRRKGKAGVKGKGKEKEQDQGIGVGKGKGKETEVETEPASKDSPFIAFPALRNLRITCFDFRSPPMQVAGHQHQGSSRPNGNGPKPSTRADDLLYILRRRFELLPGKRPQMETLAIEQCELTSEDARVFESYRTYVRDLDFDESYGYDDDDDDDDDDDFLDEDDFYDEYGYPYGVDWDSEGDPTWGPWY